MSKKSSKKSAIPAGYTLIERAESDSWPTPDTVDGATLSGVLIAYDTVEVSRKVDDEWIKVPVRIARIETMDGETRTIWESVGLKPIFSDDYTGYTLYIRYDGLSRKMPGRNQARLYTLAYTD